MNIMKNSTKRSSRRFGTAATSTQSSLACGRAGSRKRYRVVTPVLISLVVMIASVDVFTL